MTTEGVVGLFVGFLLGLISGGFLVHYRERVVERATERRQRRSLRAEIETNLDRLRRHRDDRWPTSLMREQLERSMGLDLRAATRAAIRNAYALADQYNQHIGQEYKFGSGNKTEDFVHFVAARVDPAPVEMAFRDALRGLDDEDLGLIATVARRVRRSRAPRP